MKNIYTGLFFLFATLLSFAQDTYSEDINERGNERIKSFHSDIVIHDDGDITVTENITFYVTGQNIERGIVRSLPYYFRNQLGKRKTIKTKILSIKKNGVEEPYHQDILKGGKFGARELYIGSSDEYLTLGTYTYEICYQMSNQVFHYEGFDELYWNVTGNDWAFDIDSVSATITLPNTQAINTSCYTGRVGSKARKCRTSVDAKGISFYTVERLSQNEGLTVAVSFPDGIIKKSAWYSIEQFWDEYAQEILAVLFVVLLTLYYLITWFKVGRRGVKPTVIPRFDPPLGLSAAATQFLDKLKMKDSILGTVIISIAVKGALKIECVKKKYTLIKTGENEDKLTSEELVVYNTLFSGKTKRLNLSGTYISKLRTAINKLSTSLAQKYNVKEFKKKGYSYLVMGALLSVLALNVYFFAEDYNYNVISYLLPCTLAVVSILGGIMHHKTKDSSITLLSCLFLFGYFFFWSIWFFVLVATLIKVIYSLGSSIVNDDLMSILFVVFILLAYFLYCKNFNLKPQKRLDIEAELNGFRLYLKTAEEHRLNMVMTPEHSLDLYEKMLPYAIALGVENKWNKKFKKELDLANYDPNWYSGDKPFRGNSSSLLSSFSSSVKKSSYNNTSSSSSGGSSGSSWSSSSGSSGGGSSGGGRGGGGGRGW